MRLSLSAAAVALAVLSSLPAHAQVTLNSRSVPLTVATTAAKEAIDVCKSSGYEVTATVVDVAGTAQVVLRSDHATIHTKDTSYKKAYTIATMGPIFKVDSTGDWLTILSKYPPLAGAALAGTPNVIALAGGVAFKVGDEIVGGLGVGGAPGAEKDEVCAKAGVAKVKDLLH
jgi:uncharacterized protein GlcG (DUF336 family)